MRFYCDLCNMYRAAASPSHDKIPKKTRSRKQEKEREHQWIKRRQRTSQTRLLTNIGASLNDRATRETTNYAYDNDRKAPPPRDNNAITSTPPLQHHNDENSAPSRVDHEAQVDKS
eukprot:927896_1